MLREDERRWKAKSLRVIIQLAATSISASLIVFDAKPHHPRDKNADASYLGSGERHLIYIEPKIDILKADWPLASDEIERG